MMHLYSLRTASTKEVWWVLILVVMDDALVPVLSCKAEYEQYAS